MTPTLLFLGVVLALLLLKLVVLSLRDDVSFWRGAGWLAVLFVVMTAFVWELCRGPVAEKPLAHQKQ